MLCVVTASLLFLQAIVLLVSQLVYTCTCVCVHVCVCMYVGVGLCGCVCVHLSVGVCGYVCGYCEGVCNGTYAYQLVDLCS